jgi:hypothetical protein
MFRAEQGIFRFLVASAPRNDRFKALKVIDFIGWRSVLNLSFGRACDGEIRNVIILIVTDISIIVSSLFEARSVRMPCPR